ncbi:MAG: hypothetical protein ACYC61_24315 [Isosphaeraceae bacterium]
MSRRITRPGGLVLAPALALLCQTVAEPARADNPPSANYAPTSHYEVKDVEGWAVLVNKDLLRDHSGLADQVLTLLRFNLIEIKRRVPPPAVKKLQKVRIWVEESQESTNPLCLAYHPDARAVRAIGKNPDKAGCVEVANARRFLSWSLEQPWQVLHELAHAYHHQFLPGGFENREIRAAYDRAMKTGLYKSVMRMNGKSEKGYATSNPMEYFAEATEAFFGTNDFYPFVYPELVKHDPGAARLLQKLWGGKTPHPAEYEKRLTP